MTRCSMLNVAAFTAAVLFLAAILPMGQDAHGQESGQPNTPAAVPIVFMTKDISPESLIAIYKALGQEVQGKVAVKLSMGEPGGHNYLAPALIRELVQSVNGTFVDSNTAYGGKRGTKEDHMQTARDHGFLDVAPVDILDAEGDIRLPVTGGTHLAEVRVGSHFNDYDSILVLSHFKGHAMAGFGGALKNIAIGIASPAGKCLVHTAGNSETDPFDGPEKQDDFTESMAEAAEGMIRAKGAENMVYISVMNRLSVDCDCSSTPSEPEMHDIGILASLDPVALDKACIDLVYAADEKTSASLRERMESRRGAHILGHAEKLGIGSQQYSIVSID